MSPGAPLTRIPLSTAPPRAPAPGHAVPPPSSNQLTGALPAEWGSGWSAMQDLQLAENKISGTIPAEWGGMANLQRLYLL
jgi:hypothetical protein